MKKSTILWVVLLVSLIFLPTSNLTARNNATDYYFSNINRFYQDFGKIFWDASRSNNLSIARINDSHNNSKFIYDEDGKMIKKISNASRQKYLQDQMNYFYNGNRLERVVEENVNFKRILVFDYTNWGRLYSFTEEIHFKNLRQKNIYSVYDIYKYKLDAKGNIYEVRGANKKFFGLFTTKYKIVKLFDYDDHNRLKATHDFIMPENSTLFSSKDFVIK